MILPALTKRANTLATAAVTLTASLLLSIGPANAMKIQSVTSPGGITAWLVEEHGLPLVTVQFAFLGGSSQDPEGKPGVANFLSTMLDEGAGDIKSEEFQDREEELAAKMSFYASRDSFSGTFQTLSENRDKSADLLALALNKPRFDSESAERMRRQLLASVQFDSKDPEKVAEQTWYETAYPGHPYGRPINGTAESVTSISSADLEAYRSRLFARDDLKISVVGDIDPATLGGLLDKVFGDLPAKAKPLPVAAVAPVSIRTQKLVAMDIPQSVATFGQIGLPRKDPDFIAAYILNYIIGGGGFSSRLMEEVREKRGLCYSVYSYINPLQRSSVYMGGVATKTDSMDKSLEVIRSVFSQMAKDGPTEQELAEAKQYLTGSYALNFTSSKAIGGQLLGLQIQDLPIDYVDTRNAKVEAVTIDDIRRVAQRLLKPDQFIVTVVGRMAKPGLAQN